MATATKAISKVNTLKNERFNRIVKDLSIAVETSMYDVIVTFSTLVIALLAVLALQVADYLAGVAAFILISVYLIKLIIRIVNKLDESWTVDEVGNMLASLKEQIEKIERNV